jgi:Set1/Ash2 histone methyltransferase complex subunit ASH2
LFQAITEGLISNNDGMSETADTSSINISGQKRAREEEEYGDGEGGGGGVANQPKTGLGDDDDGAGEDATNEIIDVKMDNSDDNTKSTTASTAKEETSSSSDPAVAAVSSTATTTATAAPAKPPPSSSTSSGQHQQQASVSAASAAVASQLSASMGLQGLYSLLSLTVISGATSGGGSTSSGGGGGSGAGTSSSSAGAGGSSAGANLLPTIEQVQQAATKSVTDNPPFCHLSKTDSAPQLKIASDSFRLVCKGGMRGYRMTRGSHGVSEGNYYYEVVVLDPPSASEIAQSLPSNVRLGRQLQQDMQEALRAEERAKAAMAVAKDRDKNDDDAESTASSSVTKRSKFGAHVRLGWSLRSGDLQAPVGYDRFSFAVRDIGGSKIHSSKREDNWGGEDFGPGDVVGCAISLVPGGTGGVDDSSAGLNANSGTGTSGSSSQQNQIRFFKNGYPMGEFVISKGRREGGTAFVVPDGMYYPAISLYMGASVKVNFGPNFICPPRKLPTGLKFQPISTVCKPPITVEEAIAKVTKEKVFRKSDMQQRFLDLVKGEVNVVQDTYQKQRRKHLQDVLAERKNRNLKVEDLESDEFYDTMDME